MPKCSVQNPKRMFPSKGFTLIEILVSIAVLSIVLMVVTNVFASIVRSGKEMLDSQKLTGELRNVTIDLEKEIAQGNGVSSSEGTRDDLTIFNEAGKEITYDLFDGRIQKDGISITSGNIEVTLLKFYVKKISEQPRVTIAIKAKPKNGSKVFNMQATISEKNY